MEGIRFDGQGRVVGAEVLGTVSPGCVAASLVKSTDWDAVSVLSETLPDSDGVVDRQIYADLIVHLPQVGDAPGSICSVIEIKSDDVRGYEKQLSDYSHSARRKYPQCEHIACVLLYCGRRPWSPNEPPELPEGLESAWPELATKRIMVASVHAPELLAKLWGGLRVAWISLRDMPAIASQAELWQFVDEVVLPVLDEDRQLFKRLVGFGLQMADSTLQVQHLSVIWNMQLILRKRPRMECGIPNTSADDYSVPVVRLSHRGDRWKRSRFLSESDDE